MERIKTGIHGLDELIGGGFLPGRSILVSGCPGTGKTTFGLQFICEGARMGEAGVVLSLEEGPDMWREDMKNFGYDLAKLEEEDKIAIIDASLGQLGLESNEKYILSPQEFDMNHILANVIKTANKIGAKRILIDSLPALDLIYDNENAIRSDILKMNYLLKANGLTSMIVSEIPEGSKTYSKHEVEEYIMDTVLTLHYISLGAQSGRNLIIRKMRGSDHSEDIHPIEFVKGKGIVVKSVEDELEG